MHIPVSPFSQPSAKLFSHDQRGHRAQPKAGALAFLTSVGQVWDRHKLVLMTTYRKKLFLEHKDGLGSKSRGGGQKVEGIICAPSDAFLQEPAY